MTAQQQIQATPASRSSGSVASEGLLRRLVRRLAPHDVLALTAPVFLTAAVLIAAPGPARDESLARLVELTTFGIIGIFLVRSGLLKSGPLTTLVYRLTLFGVTILTYLSLQRILPIANPNSLDGRLYELDLTLFGFEPALWLDQYVSSATTEWFSFFYYGYFFLLAVHVVPLIFPWNGGRAAAELGLGLLFCFNVAHCVYVLVPGYGPWRAIPEAFQNDLPSGFWFDVTMETVLAGSAMKDIFPSLHTAAPTYMALYSIRQRHRIPFKYSWPLTAFCAANIIGATMFLRWHWVIDVVAGLALAVAGVVVSERLVAREVRRRDAGGLQPLWPRLFESRERAVPSGGACDEQDENGTTKAASARSAPE